VRRRVPQVTEFLTRELARDGRLGACIDVSGVALKFLEREDIWGYGAIGSLVVDFVNPAGRRVILHHFMHPENPARARHAWLYLLGLDRRTLDVPDVDSGRKLRTIAFGIPPEDQIEGFSFNSDGTRVLLTTGGDRNDLWVAEWFAQPARSWSRWFRHWESPARLAPAR
jgi:hypothetical protein